MGSTSEIVEAEAEELSSLEWRRSRLYRELLSEEEGKEVALEVECRSSRRFRRRCRFRSEVLLLLDGEKRTIYHLVPAAVPRFPLRRIRQRSSTPRLRPRLRDVAVVVRGCRLELVLL